MNKLRVAIAIFLTASVLPFCWGLTILTASAGTRSVGAYALVAVVATLLVIAVNFHVLRQRPTIVAVGIGMALWAVVVAAWVALFKGAVLPGWLVFAGLYPATLWIVWSAWMFAARLRWSVRLGTLVLCATLVGPFLYYFEVEGAAKSGRVNIALRPPHSFSRQIHSALIKVTGRDLVLVPKTETLALPPQAGVKSRYTKYEYRIQMRDGKRLFTAVYAPKDDSQPYPILLNRTPYSVRPYGTDQYREHLGPSPALENSGYIFAYQDVRGRWMSEGTLVNMRPYITHKKGSQDIDESSDTYDTIDWLVKNVPNNNGKVGIWGVSYPGFYATAGMIDAHPALQAASPQAPITDWFMGDDWHHNGAVILAHMFSFMSRFDKPRPEPTAKFDDTYKYASPDGYAFFLGLGPLRDAGTRFLKGQATFWNECTEHGTYDQFWKDRNIRPHLKDIKPAVMTVGGWYDAENLFGALEVFRKVEKQSPKTSNRLVMGPWWHGAWTEPDVSKLGDVAFNANTASFYQEKIEFPFFEHYLKGKTEPEAPKAWVFETGSNVWRKYSSWPPADARARSFYFHSSGRLSDEQPSSASGSSTSGSSTYDEFRNDPSKPVPYTEKIADRMIRDYMTADQRFAARRPDVLVYATDVLPHDVTIVGPISPDLFVSTTGTDADWIVKLIDVYPDNYPAAPGTDVPLGGYQQLVRGDVMRGKFRDSFENPQPFTPGKPTRVKFTMQDVCHKFRSGHRIMVQVQSTWFPLVDRNPQQFMDIYSAKAADFHAETHRVYHAPETASRLSVLVMP